jgi:hypothetical protein
LEKLARDKHSSLLQKLANYGCKKFFNIEHWWLFEQIFSGVLVKNTFAEIH